MASYSLFPHVNRLAAIGAKVMLAVLCLHFMSRPATAGPEPDPDPQKLLFDTPYLASLKLPVSLTYAYRHHTADEKSFGANFSDKVQLDLAESDEPGGLNKVSMTVFTGSRQRVIDTRSDMRGNPVIMIFLERDLWEMKRRIGGAPVYFRNSIRRSFREASEVKRTTINYEGTDVPGFIVTIKPFENDRNADRFRQYRNKAYEFVVADAVPGGVYRIRSLVTGGAGGSELVVEDTLTLE